jgi:hypothetical protein
MANRPTDGRENLSEPEIMSPDRLRGERLRGTSHIWVSNEQGGHRRLYIGQPGLFTVILLVLLFGVVMAAVLAIFLGTFLILVPAVIVIVFTMIVAGMMRVYFNRLWSSRTAGGGWDDSDAHH